MAKPIGSSLAPSTALTPLPSLKRCIRFWSPGRVSTPPNPRCITVWSNRKNSMGCWNCVGRARKPWRARRAKKCLPISGRLIMARRRSTGKHGISARIAWYGAKWSGSSLAGSLAIRALRPFCIFARMRPSPPKNLLIPHPQAWFRQRRRSVTDLLCWRLVPLHPISRRWTKIKGQ